MKITCYVVFRHGSNAHNQSMTQVMPVGIWEAQTRAEAVALASQEVTSFNNQYLAAVPVSKVSYAQYEEALRQDAIRLEGDK